MKELTAGQRVKVLLAQALSENQTSCSWMSRLMDWISNLLTG